MRTLLRVVVLVALPFVLAAQRPWQQITVPSVREAASNFRTPPVEYGVNHWAIWGGDLTEARIVQELDQLKAHGVSVVVIGPARNMNPKYLSPEYLRLVRFAMEELRRRGMKAWIADEGSYPSGFAGGEISSDYPELRMKAVSALERIVVPGGETVSRKLPPETLSARAVNRLDDRSIVLDVASGQLNWTAPAGDWQVFLVEPHFQSSPTRYIHHPQYLKTQTNSLIDYLDPEATRAFLKTTHEEYKRVLGPELWKLVLGFFGDTPGFDDFIPWTPKMLAEFQQRKGYDLRPYLPTFFAPEATEEEIRVKADYWDVWSDLFRDNFFKVQADWCAQNDMEYLMHVMDDEHMMGLVRSQGDFFKCMRYTQVPGTDNLGQIGPDIVREEQGEPDYPKLPSSAAHLFGRPRVWTENAGSLNGGGFESGGSPAQGKWVMDYQLVRGINQLWVRGLVSYPSAGASGGPPAATPPDAEEKLLPAFIRYGNRASYLTSIGRPAAQIALYYPTTSMWLGDEDALRGTLVAEQYLSEHQRDFDYMDEEALASVVTLEKGGLRNLSGQVYRAVIIPPASVISQAALDRLRAFAGSGGRVIFLGRTPTLVAGRTFLKAAGPPDLSWAVLEAAEEFSPRVLEALPRPDVLLNRPCPLVKYLHRSLRDAELYFFFNEGKEKQSLTAVLAGSGRAQVWDAASARIAPLEGAAAAETGYVRLPLVLEPYEAKFIVIGPLPPGAGPAEPVLESAGTVLELAGDWAVDLGGKKLTTELKSWADLGVPAFTGPSRYRKEFRVPAGKGRLFLECGDVRYWARVWVNGVDLGERPWGPYRWEVTKALKAGTNVLEMEVFGAIPPRSGGMPGMPAMPAPAPGAAGRGTTRAAAGGGGRGRGSETAAPLLSGLLPPVRLVAAR